TFSLCFFFSSRRRHTRSYGDWSSDVALPISIAIGVKMPWVDKDTVGVFMFKPYLFSFATIVIPNLLLVAAIFFAVAILTRSLLEIGRASCRESVQVQVGGGSVEENAVL